MPGNSVRFHDKISKKSVNVTFTEKLKDQIIEAAGDFFPYPIIIQHDGHYTILHMDQDFNDRGTVQTKILINLDNNKVIDMDSESSNDNNISNLKEEMMCTIKEEILDEILAVVKLDLQKEIKEQIKKELETSGAIKPKKKTSRKKKSSSQNIAKSKSTTKKSSGPSLDELSGMGFENLDI